MPSIDPYIHNSFVEYGSFLVHKFDFYQTKMKEDIFKTLKDYEAFCIGHIFQQPGDLGCQDLFLEVSASFQKICKSRS